MISDFFSEFGREPLVRIRESHEVSSLTCFIGFQGHNLRIIILNDGNQKVFDMNCLRNNDEREKADFETLRAEIWCQMPRGGKVFICFGKDHEKHKLGRRAEFERRLMDFLQREIKRHKDFEAHGDKQVQYTIELKN